MTALRGCRVINALTLTALVVTTGSCYVRIMVHSSQLQSRYREVRNQKTEYDSFMCVLLSNGRRPFYLWLFRLRVLLNIEAVVIFRPTDGWNSSYRHFSYSYHRVSIRSICCEENSNQITFLPRWEFHFGVWGGRCRLYFTGYWIRNRILNISNRVCFHSQILPAAALNSKLLWAQKFHLMFSSSDFLEKLIIHDGSIFMWIS